MLVPNVMAVFSTVVETFRTKTRNEPHTVVGGEVR